MDFTITSCNWSCFYSNEMEVVRAGYFLIDRHDAEMSEPHKVSLAWTQPAVLINLVFILL